MKKIVSLLALIAFLAIPNVSFAADPEPQAFIRGIRPLGMGGAFTAVADDQNAIFYNPAGLTQRRGAQLTIFELPIAVSEDIFSFYNYYKDNEDKLKDFDTLSTEDKTTIINDISDKITKYNTHIRAGFPNASFLSGPGTLCWGLGLYSQADMGFKIKNGIIVPNISFWGTVDVISVVPLAHKIEQLPFVPGKLSLGANLKYINRARIAEYNKSVLEFENFDPLLQWGQGMGLDLGTLYQPNDRWNVALHVSDFGATPLKFKRVESTKSAEIKEDTTGIILPQCSAGLAYIPSRIPYWPGKSIGTRDRLIFACDVRDILNSDEPLMEDTFWKKVHLGAELRWFAFALRGGFNSGYPSFGAGINLYLLQIEYAYWGDELGRYAGQQAEWNHQLTIAMRFGQNKGRAWGRAATPVATPVKEERPQEEPAPQQEPELKTDLEQGATQSIDTPTTETQEAPTSQPADTPSDSEADTPEEEAE